MEAWTVREVLDYCDHWRASFVLDRNGAPAVHFPIDLVDRYGRILKDRERAKVIAEVVPHIKARRLEILTFLTHPDERPQEPEESDARDYLAESLAARAEQLAKIIDAANRRERRVWWMVPPDLRPETGPAVPGAATYVVVEGPLGEGDATCKDPKTCETVKTWHVLPAVDGAPDTPVRAAKPKPRKVAQWNT